MPIYNPATPAARKWRSSAITPSARSPGRIRSHQGRWSVSRDYQLSRWPPGRLATGRWKARRWALEPSQVAAAEAYSRQLGIPTHFTPGWACHPDLPVASQALRGGPRLHRSQRRVLGPATQVGTPHTWPKARANNLLSRSSEPEVKELGDSWGELPVIETEEVGYDAGQLPPAPDQVQTPNYDFDGNDDNHNTPDEEQEAAE